MLTINRLHAKPPVGGHNFPGHGGMKADSVGALIDRILDYRGSNGLPQGNPEAELAAHYETIAPWLVQRDDRPDPPVPLVDAVAEWIMRTWRLHPVRLEYSSVVAIQRREICKSCPFRVVVKFPPPGIYGTHAESRGILLLGYVQEDEIAVCEHHKWNIAIASRLAVPESVSLPPAPEKCWVTPPNEHLH